jgi:tocopherol O-methyltransferase
LLVNEGFRNIEIEDATKHIVPSAKRLYLAYFPGVVGGFLYKLFNPKPTVYGRKNIDTAYLQYKALKKGLWKYHILLAQK